MTGEELINRGSCGGASAGLGSNLSGGCLQFFKETKAILLFSPSARLDPALDWSEQSFWENLLVTGQLVILDGVTSFQENGPDDATEDEEDGTREVTNEGKYTFVAGFKKGLYNNKVLHSYKGFGNYKVGMVDSKGRILMTQDSSGWGVGFNNGMLQPRKLQFATTTTQGREGLLFQFLDRFELDESYVLIERGNLNFDPRTLKGVKQVRLMYVNAPANGDNQLIVKAVLAQDNKTLVEDLEAGDFAHSIGTTPANPTGAAFANEQYTLTGVTALATGDNTTLQIFDVANNRGIVNKNGNLYQSASLAATVIA